MEEITLLCETSYIYEDDDIAEYVVYNNALCNDERFKYSGTLSGAKSAAIKKFGGNGHITIKVAGKNIGSAADYAWCDDTKQYKWIKGIIRD